MNAIVKLYGENVVELVLEEVKKLALNSNIPFDKKYVDLGMSFFAIKCTEIVEGKKKEQSLTSLVSESFGEAAMYKYNVGSGVL